jgi:hypothetical protein
MAEFDAWVIGGEVPTRLALLGVDGALPGCEFGVEGVEVADAAVETLPRQRGQLDLGDVEAGPVFGGVVDLQALGQGNALVGARRPRRARRCRGC